MSLSKHHPVRHLELYKGLCLDDEYLNGDQCKEDCIQGKPNHFILATLRNNVGFYRGWRQWFRRKEGKGDAVRGDGEGRVIEHGKTEQVTEKDRREEWRRGVYPQISDHYAMHSQQHSRSTMSKPPPLTCFHPPSTLNLLSLTLHP